jgi:hypothetical protein
MEYLHTNTYSYTHISTRMHMHTPGSHQVVYEVSGPNALFYITPMKTMAMVRKKNGFALTPLLPDTISRNQDSLHTLSISAPPRGGCNVVFVLCVWFIHACVHFV